MTILAPTSSEPVAEGNNTVELSYLQAAIRSRVADIWSKQLEQPVKRSWYPELRWSFSFQDTLRSDPEHYGPRLPRCTPVTSQLIKSLLTDGQLLDMFRVRQKFSGNAYLYHEFPVFESRATGAWYFADATYKQHNFMRGMPVDQLNALPPYMVAPYEDPVAVESLLQQHAIPQKHHYLWANGTRSNAETRGYRWLPLES